LAAEAGIESIAVILRQVKAGLRELKENQSLPFHRAIKSTAA
jgi:hypothetical protein